VCISLDLPCISLDLPCISLYRSPLHLPCISRPVRLAKARTGRPAAPRAARGSRDRGVQVRVEIASNL
jgi:hypothetical protein